MKNYKFLIIRQDRIGDAVLSTAIPHEIKKNFPKSYVAILVREYTKAIFENNPYIDEVIIFNRKKSLFEFAKEIRSYKFDYSFALLPNEFINWGLFIAGIRNRIGVGHKFFQFVTNTKSVYRRKYIEDRHEADYCMDFLRKISLEPETINPEIFLTNDERAKANKYRSFFAGKKLVGFNSTSGNSAPNINIMHYRVIIEKIIREQPEIQVIVTDLNIPKELDEIENVHYFNRDSTLREDIVSFASLDLLISSSTGPMHIASALKVPTLSFFCPLPVCSPNRWGPLGNYSTNILPESEYCDTKCPNGLKNCEFKDSKNFTVDNIVTKILSAINR